MKKNLLSLLAAMALIPNSLQIAQINATAAEDTIKIMPLGDSITDGYWTEGGYRKYLSYKLVEKGYTNIDFVGPNGSDEATFTYDGKNISYDNNHAGYNGYSIQSVSNILGKLNGIMEALKKGNCMEQYDPDVILLEIGTNDVLSLHFIGLEKRLDELLDYLLENMDSDGVIFLSTIPDAKMDAVMNGVANLIIKSYNGLVEKTAKKYADAGKNVKFVDVNSVIDPSTDLYDELHPNEKGYEKMGEYWGNILESYFNGNENPVTVQTGNDSCFFDNAFLNRMFSIMKKIYSVVHSIFNK